MDQKNLLTYDVPKKVFDDVEKYCKLNKIDNINDFMFKCFKQGFDIEKYGLLGEDGELKVIEKEVVKEVIVEKKIPIEIIKEVPVEKLIEVIKEVPVEKLVEVVKEVPVEKVIEKIIQVSDDTQINELLSKIQHLEIEIKEKNEESESLKKELEQKPKQIKDDNKTKLLQETLQKLKKQNIDFQKEIEDLKEKLKQLSSFDNQGKVVYHRGSDINKDLIK